MTSLDRSTPTRRGASGTTSTRRPRGTRLSRPNYVVPGQTIFGDRRCLDRRFSLRPDAQMRRLFLYLIAVYAERHGILMHFLTLLSTHYHTIFTDAFGNRGDFYRDLHAILGKSTQVYRGMSSPLTDKTACRKRVKVYSDWLDD